MIMNLEPYTDGTIYDNYVFDEEKKELRGIVEVERLIVDYCFVHSHHINNACAELGYRKFEREFFSSKILIEAGKAIYEKEYNNKRKTKIAKTQKRL